ncbi:MAG: hypothetical protein QOE38_373 [Thermoleophilaceae bacterium]|nr:hypothetical protein [Thermoleophilaceae bacterium]
MCTVTTVNSRSTSGDDDPLAAAGFLVRRDAHADCRVVDQVMPRAADGEVVVEVSSFGFSSNNITYAEMGDALGYWRFFPAEEGWGSVPVWGFGRVAESGHEAIASGTRVYGLLPPATHAVLRPRRCSPAGFMEAGEHRRTLPGAYNWYEVAGSDPTFEAQTEAEQMLLRPLFFTSFLLADLIGEDETVPGRVIISSASSKTAHGTAYLLAAAGGNTVGLTSPSRAGFVRSLGVYDDVVPYDELDRLDEGAATFLDFAGDPQIRAAVHQQVGAQLTRSLSIGMTHVGKLEIGGTAELPGARPTFFFAPDRIKERTRDWGRDGLVQRFAAAWTDYVQWVDTWLQVTRTAGLDGLRAVYLDVLSGNVDPAHGHIIELHGPPFSDT